MCITINNDVKIKKLQGEEVLSYLPDLAALRTSEFKNYPYLYDGDIKREHEYLSTYVKCKDFVLLAMIDDSHVIGVTTGIPIKEEEKAFKIAFIDSKYDIKDVFYLGETIILPEYRGRGLSRLMIKTIEQHAVGQGFKVLSLATINRSPDDIRKPEDYVSLDGLWNKYGYDKQDGIKVNLSWREIGQSEETKQEMIFWFKELGDNLL